LETKKVTSSRFVRFWKILGPGVVTGAADDDPSGIATYTQTGAKFGYGQLWTAVAMLPLMIAIQEACARIGAVNGHGLAAVIKANYSKNVDSAADAAKALEPLVQSFPHAGFLSKLIFATGIIGLGLLAIPVLSGSAAYALSEAFNLKEGLNLKLKKAHGFYGVITIATLVGLMINFIGIDPIKALVFTAVFNGVAAVPLIFLIARIARNPKIMGEYRSGWLSNTVVWITFVVMLASAIAMFYTLFSE